MRRLILALTAMSALSSTPQVQALSPRDFAYSQIVTPDHEASAYRFSVPLSAYQNTFSADLADLRVFNADGVAVPYALSQPAVQAATGEAPSNVPLFPLHEGSQILIDGLHLTIQSAGSAVNLQTQGGTPTNAAVRQYLLDARMLGSAFSAMQLYWPDGAPEFNSRISVEVSDDLSTWRSALAAAPIANLRANGQTLVENRVVFAPTRAKFWRLSWIGVVPAFELTKVVAEPAVGLAEPKYESMDVSSAVDLSTSREYVFDLGGHPPISRVNVLLTEPNSALNLEISSRPTASAPWRPLTHALFYRLKAQNVEQENPVLSVGPDADRYWRARAIGPDEPSTSAPRLHVEWMPSEITFLAQGRPPFLLGYGNATAKGAESDLSHLPSTSELATATLGPMQVSGGLSRLMAPAAPFPRTRFLLWGVLIAAVVILSLMAYRVLKDA